MDSSLVIIGLSSRTSPSDVRARFWMDEIARTEAAGKLARAEGISEATVLVAPARVEYIVWANDPSDAATSILQLLSQKFGLKLCEWEQFYRVTDTAAVAHVFSIACQSPAEDSEDGAQTREQLHAAWKQSVESGTSGRMLEALFTKAFALAERVKSNAVHSGAVAELIATEARAFQRKLIAEQIVPAAAVLRVRVEDICRQELEAFERALGPINEPQRNTLTEMRVRVTSRIASEVEHELKGLKQTAEQQNLAEAAQRLINHGQMRDLVNRSQN